MFISIKFNTNDVETKINARVYDDLCHDESAPHAVPRWFSPGAKRDRGEQQQRA